MYNLETQRFGRLVVIRKTDIRKPSSNCIFWECICDCGNIAIVDTNSLVYGSTKSCGCLRRDIMKNNHYSRKSFGESARNNLYVHYKHDALRRKLAFELSKESFYSLTKGNCFYCGKEPDNTFSWKGMYGYYIYNGVDRVDNNAGYTVENCVSCCKRCNQAKNDMSLDEFKAWILSVYKYFMEDK